MGEWKIKGNSQKQTLIPEELHYGRYTELDGYRDADKIYGATLGKGLFFLGIGTNEDKFFKALEGKAFEEVSIISECFK